MQYKRWLVKHGIGLPEPTEANEMMEEEETEIEAEEDFEHDANDLEEESPLSEW